MINFTINGKQIEVSENLTILEAARFADIYIPTLCSHPDLLGKEDVEASNEIFQNGIKIKNISSEKERKRCGLCLVEMEGVDIPVNSCSIPVKEGMVVFTDTDAVKAKRKENLAKILKRHRHACLTCAQQEGCSRSQCSSNVPENERCCIQFGHCELQNVSNYIGIPENTPKWLPTDLPIAKDDPLFERDYNLCIGCTRCIRVCASVRGVNALGFVYDENGDIQVGYLEKTPAESGCRFCTACVAICPTGALTDKSVRAGKEAQDLVPCRNACPANVDIPLYLRLIAEKKYDEANAVIREKVPFPAILGRICVHPCESVCRRGEVNEAVSICALKRYAADMAQNVGADVEKSVGANIENNVGANGRSPLPNTGKKIAIIGAGPAGLTAGFYLRKKGHSVTIFDAKDKAGGMMRYGIPAYRLPREILDKEINEILSKIDFKPSVFIGKNYTIDDLKSDGYEALFIAVGAQKSRRIDIEGSDNKDVLWGTEFLYDIADEKKIKLKDKVIVIGGGNVAIDVAMTAKRCGAKEVIMACLEKKDEMPAHIWEVEGAVKEGISLMTSWSPDNILIENEKITGIKLVECVSVFDKKGNFSPEYSDTKKIIKADQIIMAIGQATDLSFINDKVSIDKGLIVVNQDTLETKTENIFAGGDAANTFGMAVIYAIAAGRKAASSIDMKLGGDGDIEEKLFKREKHSGFIGKVEGFALRERQNVIELDPSVRWQSFNEIYKGFDEEKAVCEAKRCLQCDLRLDIACNPEPPENLLFFTKENIDNVPESEGVFRLMDESKKVIMIKGAADIKKELLLQIEDNENAAWFEYEEDKMYSQRESELIQKHLQEHGEMPGGDEDDDLF
jgi:formate dehydrogenase (NADP+) beta subunit